MICMEIYKNSKAWRRFTLQEKMIKIPIIFESQGIENGLLLTLQITESKLKLAYAHNI